MTKPSKKSAQDYFNSLTEQIRHEDRFYRAVLDGDLALVGQLIDAHPQAVRWQERSWRDSGECTTALMLAAGKGDTGMIALLLSRGAQVNDLDYYHANALTHAVAKGHKAAVDLLIGHGADVTQRSYLIFDGTPISIAGKKGYKDIVASLRKALSPPKTPDFRR